MGTVFDDASKELVGLAAHERAEVTVPDEGVIVATKIEVVAIARAWQGKQLGSGKVRVSDAVMTTLMNDIPVRMDACATFGSWPR